MVTGVGVSANNLSRHSTGSSARKGEKVEDLVQVVRWLQDQVVQSGSGGSGSGSSGSSSSSSTSTSKKGINRRKIKKSRCDITD